MAIPIRLGSLKKFRIAGDIDEDTRYNLQRLQKAIRQVDSQTPTIAALDTDTVTISGVGARPLTAKRMTIDAGLQGSNGMVRLIFRIDTNDASGPTTVRMKYGGKVLAYVDCPVDETLLFEGTFWNVNSGSQQGFLTDRTGTVSECVSGTGEADSSAEQEVGVEVALYSGADTVKISGFVAEVLAQ